MNQRTAKSEDRDQNEAGKSQMEPLHAFHFYLPHSDIERMQAFFMMRFRPYFVEAFSTFH
ncbi:MAG: hypothetical protein J7498_04305 [Sphingobium sp.]|nr:hypothetical protein [Sphingobium sp.]